MRRSKNCVHIWIIKNRIIFGGAHQPKWWCKLLENKLLVAEWERRKKRKKIISQRLNSLQYGMHEDEKCVNEYTHRRLSEMRWHEHQPENENIFIIFFLLTDFDIYEKCGVYIFGILPRFNKKRREWITCDDEDDDVKRESEINENKIAVEGEFECEIIKEWMRESSGRG